MLRTVYPVCCGMDVHKSLVIAALPQPTTRVLPRTKANGFPPSPAICGVVPHGFLKMTAATSAWSQRVNTGFLSATCWSLPAKSFSLTRSASRQFAERKPTSGMPDGLPTSSNTTSFRAASTRRHPPASGFGALSLEAHQFYNRGEKPCSELSDCFQHQAG